jgi:hypothetical protein
VSSTVLKPGETAKVKVSILMHKGMGGMHLFNVTVASNDPGEAPVVSARVNYTE